GVERLVQGMEDAADIEGRASGDQRLEVVLDGAHEVPHELGAALPTPRLGLADADDAFVGVYTHDQRLDRLALGALRDLERLGEGQAQRDRLDRGDLHAVSPPYMVSPPYIWMRLPLEPRDELFQGRRPLRRFGTAGRVAELGVDLEILRVDA